MVRIFPYSDQKNPEYGHFSRSGTNSHEIVDLFTFTKETIYRKLAFCAVALFMFLLIHLSTRNNVWSL